MQKLEFKQKIEDEDNEEESLGSYDSSISRVSDLTQRVLRT
jgi:hypothetical protein